MKWASKYADQQVSCASGKVNVVVGDRTRTDLVSRVLGSGSTCHGTAVPPKARGQDVSQPPSSLGVDTSLQSPAARGILSVLPRPSSVCWSASTIPPPPLGQGHPSCWIRAHPRDLVFPCSQPQGASFQTRSHSEVLGKGRLFLR